MRTPQFAAEKGPRSVTSQAMGRHAKAPVFILGCPRSGTTLLYHMLLSSGNFAVYLAESHVFDKIAPAFGNLSSLKNREKLMDAWLQSDYFRRSGLEAKEIRPKVLSDCRNAGDFLRIVMESVASRQGVERWAENTPAHLVFIPQIKKTIPDALIVHIIRDGRDVAISMNRMEWGSPFSWDRKHGLMVSGLRWEWMVQKGREYGWRLGPDYMEVHYEELTQYPRETLARLGAFIGHDLNYEQILQNAIGTVSEPNTSFRNGARNGNFRPIGRWKLLGDQERTRLERLLGARLQELGYPANRSEGLDLRAWRLRKFYTLYREIKLRLRQSPLSKFLIHKERILRAGILSEQESHWKVLAERPFCPAHTPEAHKGSSHC